MVSTRNGKGFHWWRDLIMSSWSCAWQVWSEQRESVALGYATESREFDTLNPQPTLKQFMIGLKGTKQNDP